MINVFRKTERGDVDEGTHAEEIDEKQEINEEEDVFR